MRLIRLAKRKAKELSELLQASLKTHDIERVQARIRRHNHTPVTSQLQGRAVTVLNSDDIIGVLRHQPTLTGTMVSALADLVGYSIGPCSQQTTQSLWYLVQAWCRLNHLLCGLHADMLHGNGNIQQAMSV